MIETALYKHLIADAPVAALIGTPLSVPVGPRLSKPPAPQAQALPFVTYARVGRRTPITHTGERGPHRVRFQVDCWAATDAAATNVADAVEAALLGFVGPKYGYEVFLTEYAGRDEDLFEEAPLNQRRVSRDYFVHYRDV